MLSCICSSKTFCLCQFNCSFIQFKIRFSFFLEGNRWNTKKKPSNIQYENKIPNPMDAKFLHTVHTHKIHIAWLRDSQRLSKSTGYAIFFQISPTFSTFIVYCAHTHAHTYNDNKRKNGIDYEYKWIRVRNQHIFKFAARNWFWEFIKL